MRVGEKEIFEQAAIVERYADLFTRPQLEELIAAEDGAEPSDRERLYRLRKTCETGLVVRESRRPRTRWRTCRSRRA